MTTTWMAIIGLYLIIGFSISWWGIFGQEIMEQAQEGQYIESGTDFFIMFLCALIWPFYPAALLAVGIFWLIGRFFKAIS